MPRRMGVAHYNFIFLNYVASDLQSNRASHDNKNIFFSF